MHLESRVVAAARAPHLIMKAMPLSAVACVDYSVRRAAKTQDQIE